MRPRASTPASPQAPRGNIGDRDQIILDGVRLELQEAQYVPGDYTSWRTFLDRSAQRHPATARDRHRRRQPLVRQPDGDAPDGAAGRPAVLVTMYVFTEGAAAGETGPLIYYTER